MIDSSVLLPGLLDLSSHSCRLAMAPWAISHAGPWLLDWSSSPTNVLCVPAAGMPRHILMVRQKARADKPLLISLNSVNFSMAKANSWQRPESIWETAEVGGDWRTVAL